MPRKELVIELAKEKFKTIFNIQPILVYGGHTECLEGQFIICTNISCIGIHECLIY